MANAAKANLRGSLGGRSQNEDTVDMIAIVVSASVIFKQGRAAGATRPSPLQHVTSPGAQRHTVPSHMIMTPPSTCQLNLGLL